MAKTREELNQLKKDYEAISSKLKELSEEELKIVIGGQDDYDFDRYSYWYDKVQQIVNSGLPMSEREAQLRKLLVDLEQDLKIEITDKEFLKEQINSIINLHGR